MKDFTKHLRLFLASLTAAGWLAVVAGTPVYAASDSAAEGLARAIAAQAQHTDDLLAIPGVVGTAVGLGPNGDPVVKIYTAREGIAGLPGTLDGVGVRVEVTGRFFALHHVCDHFGGPPGSDTFPCDPNNPPPDEGGGDADPTGKFRPVPIGVSSGNIESIIQAGGFVSCSSGTLGAWLTGGGNSYALSNNHIYALENGNEADVPPADIIGTDIVQPGTIDTDPVCNVGVSEGDIIGTLAAFVPIVSDVIVDGALNDNPTDNLVDAAIALKAGGILIDTGTPAGGYGTPTSALAACGVCLGEDVQKYGRTSGLKKGTVSGINAIVNVGYDAGIARFVGQIIVSGSKGPFIKGGDSGSLLVTDPGNAPVGLLFAGDNSGKNAIANPIGDVLSLLDAESGIPTLSVDGSAP
jgi:hypothetical protein